MPDLKSIKKIAVVGAGTMGSGIAQLAAMAGYACVLYDLSSEALDRAKSSIKKNLEGGVKRGKISEEEAKVALEQIEFTTEFSRLTADVIIEAILEKLDIKRELFQKLAAQNKSNCILATNTSSIPITRIARSTPHPERVVGMHFFNPAHIMKLVEIVSGAGTDPEVAKTITALAEKMGKKTVQAKDEPGFIVNRVARHFYVEALQVLEERVAQHEDIDLLIENLGFRMGPFRLMDLIGVETNFSVTSSMFESFFFHSKFRPSRIQQKLVDAGFHGRKSGKGFYEYGE